MNVTIEASGNLMVCYLIGELDHHSAGAVREKIDEAISAKMPLHLILDFKNISFMDSSGIGLVMGRYRLIKCVNPASDLEIRNVTVQAKKIMELAGLGKIAQIVEAYNEKTE
ncbi:MAG: anti-sigma factor antagonist [Eubacterium sp.]|nr:anti-sigma factor antagonist [Eubacterium sp.]